MKPLQLYVHIPFCLRKCNYCDFLSAASSVSERRAYTTALCREIEAYGRQLKEEYQLVTIYIGGGTPSFLELPFLCEIFEQIRSSFFCAENAEITLEANPGTVTSEGMATYAALGINRLSIGLQSTREEELKLLGRIHNFPQFLKTYELARTAGIDNINVDLMYGLPGQTLFSLQTSLRDVIRLKPEHISTYSLIIEEGTPFHEKYAADAKRQHAGEATEFLPTEEEEIAQEALVHQLLTEAGFHRYEISNYARPGRESRHNSGYWKRAEYLGLGLGASSMMQETRWSNERDLSIYCKDPTHATREIVPIARKDAMAEFMYLGLRMTEGITYSDFRSMFGLELDAVYGNVIADLAQQGFLTRSFGRVFLTDRGRELSNPVLAEFLP